MTIKALFDGKKIVLPKELEGQDPCVVEIVLAEGAVKTHSPNSLWDVVARSKGGLSAETILRETSDDRDAWGCQ